MGRRVKNKAESELTALSTLSTTVQPTETVKFILVLHTNTEALSY
jgi:hypothetical protein